MTQLTSVPLVYIAGSYRAPNAWLVEQNIRRAESLGYEVAKLGAYPCIPHSNTRYYFEHVQPDEFWLAGTLAMLAVCNAAVFTADYERSHGAREEMAFCIATGTPWFVACDDGMERFAAWLRERERRNTEMLLRAAGVMR